MNCSIILFLSIQAAVLRERERRPLGRSGMGKSRRDGISFSSDLFLRSTALRKSFLEGISGFSYCASVGLFCAAPVASHDFSGGRHHLNRLILCLSWDSCLSSFPRPVTNHSAGMGQNSITWTLLVLSNAMPLACWTSLYTIFTQADDIPRSRSCLLTTASAARLLQHRHVDLSDASHKLLLYV